MQTPTPTQRNVWTAVKREKSAGPFSLWLIYVVLYSQFQTELRRILISLIEASQRILCLNTSAAKIFKQAEGGWEWTLVCCLVTAGHAWLTLCVCVRVCVSAHGCVIHFLYIWLGVCMRVHMCVCVCVNILLQHVYLCTCIERESVCGCVCVWEYVCVCVWVCGHFEHVCACVCVYIVCVNILFEHVCMCVWMHVWMYMPACVCSVCSKQVKFYHRMLCFGVCSWIFCFISHLGVICSTSSLVH